MSDAQWNSLIGAFGVPGALVLCLLGWMLIQKIKANGNGGNGHAATDRITDKIAESERAILKEIADTRHSLRNALIELQAEIVLYFKDHK